MSPSQSLASSPDAASGSQAPPETASDLLRRCRWADALRVLGANPGGNPGAVPGANLATTLQIRLAKNMLAMQTHRPEIYATITSTPASGRYRLVTVPGVAGNGQLSITKKQLNGRDVLLCPGGNPAAATEASLKHLRPMLDRATPVAICGIGDGALPAAIAELPAPTKPIVPGLLPVVYLIEPDHEILLHGFMLRDFTGADGPIENARYIWCVGPRWRDRLLSLLRADPFLPRPIGLIDPGYGCPELITEVESVNHDLDRWEEHVARDVAAAYADVTPGQLVEIFSSSPPGTSRPPRAMLLTSRFTTVLQHSIRDLAAAMDSLGWETRIVIEPSAHHQMPNVAVRQAILDFRPDAVFTIDHLRRERPEVFPPSLPFVCWVQDDLPNLTAVVSGKSITVRDFVLITGAKSYVDKFEYPARQCIYLGKLTRIAKPQAAERTMLSTGLPDVTFVSNASAIPADVARKLHDEFSGQPVLQELMRRAGERVFNLYASSGYFQTAGQARRIIIDCEAQLGGRLSTDASRESFALWLVNQFNNLLYRQQALRWVVAACDRLGLRLGLYGNGWKKNPEFARFARGPVAYGAALEELTRRSPINLQIVPFSCLHQRLLDGLAAEGFFLIRGHPIDAIAAEMWRLLQKLPVNINNLADARRMLPPSERAAWNDLVARLNVIVDGDDPDPIANFRCRQSEGHGYLYETMPRLDEVTFHDEVGLERQIKMFMASPEERSGIIAEQRRFVEEHYAYEAGVRRVMRSISGLIASEGKS